MDAYNREREAEKYYEEYKKKEAVAKFLGWLFTGLGTLEGATQSGVDLAEENMLPENQLEDILRSPNAIDGANYPYPVDGYN